MPRVDFPELQAGYLGLLHAEAPSELALRKIVLSAVANDGDRDRARQRGPLPLSPELRIGAELLGDQLVVGLHLAQLHALYDNTSVIDYFQAGPQSTSNCLNRLTACATLAS